jgi:hypothetical protein
MQRDEMRVMMRRLTRIDNIVDTPDTDLDTYLDEGYNEVLAQGDWPWCYVATPDAISMIVGTKEYAVAAGVVQVLSVVNVTQNYALKEVSPAEWVKLQNSTTSSSQPVVYAYINGFINVFPTPANTDSLEAFYYEQPAFAAADATEPDFDSVFHTILVNWGLHRLWEQEEDFERSDDYRARFEAQLARMKAYYNTLNRDRPTIYGSMGLPGSVSNMPWLSDAASGGAV